MGWVVENPLPYYLHAMSEVNVDLMWRGWMMDTDTDTNMDIVWLLRVVVCWVPATTMGMAGMS